MKYSVINVEYVDSMGTDITPANAARISFGNKTDTLTDKDKKLINYLADNDHLSPFEHQTLTVIVHCPLYIRSQIHRHRTFAYNEISRRYTKDNLTFYQPLITDVRKQSKDNKQASDGSFEYEDAIKALMLMEQSANNAIDTYNKLITMGVCREQARGILPQTLFTSFYMTGSLRNWCHFLKLRLDAHAQKEVRMVAEQVAIIIKNKWPVSFEALMKND